MDFLNHSAMLIVHNLEQTRRYLEYAVFVSPDIEKEVRFIRLKSMVNGAEPLDEQYIGKLTKSAYQKARNYEPPKNYCRIDEGC